MDINECVQTIEIWVDYLLLRLQKMYRRPPVVRRFWNEFCNGCAFYDGQNECLKCVWSWSIDYKPSKTVPLKYSYNICFKIFILHNLALNLYRNSNPLHIWSFVLWPLGRHNLWEVCGTEGSHRSLSALDLRDRTFFRKTSRWGCGRKTHGKNTPWKIPSIFTHADEVDGFGVYGKLLVEEPEIPVKVFMKKCLKFISNINK